ncbi:MAG: DMT family transporter [Gammaproteobacteria bacterium]
MNNKFGITRNRKRLAAFYQRLPASVQGIFWMVLSTLLFASMHGVIRALSAEMHPFQIAFLRNVFGLLIFLPWFWQRGLSLLHTEQLGLHCLRATIMSANMLAAFTAISLIPLAQVAALQMAMPLAITLGAILFLGEKPAFAPLERADCRLLRRTGYYPPRCTGDQSGYVADALGCGIGQHRTPDGQADDGT